ncbi:MAG: amidohydrolase family protein [Anaerolineaceae bacterium]|nr:amidohydrolase family protein [Anaerolineaceae bacterium]
MASSTIIHNGTIIDGTGAAPRRGWLRLEGERIAEMGSGPPPRGDREIDAGGQTILPGFIDAHAHVTAQFDGVMQMISDPFSLRFYRSIEYMRNTLNGGVTTVRDAGGADLGVKQAVEMGLVEGPRLQISITILGITGGHSDNWLPSGVDIGTDGGYPGCPSGICDGVEEVRKKVREVLRAGAEVIKICTTGGIFTPTDHPEFTQFSPEELHAIVQEAEYRRGIKVMAHAQGLEGVRNAVEAGIHSIEHGVYLDDAVIELMKERGTFLVPTLVTPVGILEAAEASPGDVPEYAARKAREVVEVHRDSIALAHEAGVKIAMGTDCVVVPHGQNLRELGLMCEAGLSPMESIVASTKTAAECLGWQADIGTLEAGKLADVVICQGDPLANIRILEDNANIALVMQGGRVLKDARAA